MQKPLINEDCHSTGRKLVGCSKTAASNQQHPLEKFGEISLNRSLNIENVMKKVSMKKVSFCTKTNLQLPKNRYRKCSWNWMRWKKLSQDPSQKARLKARTYLKMKYFQIYFNIFHYSSHKALKVLLKTGSRRTDKNFFHEWNEML